MAGSLENRKASPRGFAHGKAGCLIVAAIAVSVIWLLPWWSAGKGVSPAEANAEIGMKLVPDGASDVSFTVARFRLTIFVNCKLDQAGFDKWCQQQGWRPAPIPEGHPEFISTLGDGLKFSESRIVTDGLSFYARPYGGIYDAKEGRAYITYCNH